MSDDRWGWVTAPAATTPQPTADGAEQKQHFTNSPAADAGRDALDLWAPATQPDADSIPGDGLAYSDVTDPAPHDSVAVGGHGPGDDAPTAQWPAPALAEQNWTDQWATEDSDGLDGLVVDGRPKKARARTLRRIGIVAGFLIAIAVVLIVATTQLLPSTDSTPSPAKADAGSAPEGWCATGANGDTTTVAAAAQPTTPTGAVSAFLSGLIDARSAATARAVMSQTAPAPTLDALEGWITALPPATNGWCAQITTTDSAARVLVELRLHTGDTHIRVANRATFYVAATTPTSWAIDGIVSDEGSQP